MKISVILPIKNPVSTYGTNIIDVCLTSLFEQTYQNWELLLCNFGEINELDYILQHYPSEKIRIIPNCQNFTHALNQGILEAAGTLIARQDLDDFSDSKRFEEQINFLKENKTVKLVGTFGYSFTEDKIDYFPQIEYMAEYPEILQHFIQVNKNQVKTDYVMNPFIHGSVIFYKDLFDSIDLYNERYSQAQDLDLWCRIMLKHNVANLPKYLYYWRNSEKSATNSKKELTVKFGWEIFEKYLSALEMRFNFISSKKDGQKIQQMLDHHRKIIAGLF